MDHIIYGPSVSEKTNQNIALGLGQYLRKASESTLDKIFMIDAESEEKITCGEVLESSFKLAGYLESLNCKEGCRVAIVSENRFEYLSCILAILHNKAVFTCINPLYSASELIHAFKISTPLIVICTANNLEKIQKVQHTCGFIQSVVNLDELNIGDIESKIITEENVDPNKTTAILYSSGTTGLSKGVELMHRSFIFLMEIYRTEQFLKFPHNNSISGILPMCHIYGLFLILSSFVLGHQYILIKRYSKITFPKYIQKYKMSTLYIVPTIALDVSKLNVDDYDFSSVKYISSGGAPILKKIEDVLKAKFKCHFLQNYGMTETTSMSLLSLPTSKPGTTGRLLPGMMAKIIDVETGISLGPYKSGEYCVKGPLLMKGYCENGSNELNSFDTDGWLHSGDIAYYDDDYDFYIVDRIKELIKFKGFQVPPSEIEILLLQHPDIEAVGVVGVPDEEAGELPRAYVVKKQGSNITGNEIQTIVADNLSPFKKLRGGVIFVESLPKTISGKVMRKELKKWVTAGV